MLELEYFKGTRKLKVGLLMPAIRYKHILPSYLKISRFLKNLGHEAFLVEGCYELPVQPDVFILSTVFTFYSKRYSGILSFYQNKYKSSKFFVGGVFASLIPDYFEQKHGIKVSVGLSDELDSMDYDFSLFPDEKRLAIYTSRGCINKCGFCCVPKIEGEMKCKESIYGELKRVVEEKKDIKSIIILDNNFSCHVYFEKIVEDLVKVGLPVDFSQGLDCEKMTEDKMKLLSRLKFGSQSDKGVNYIRFAFDKFFQSDGIERTLRWCKELNIGASYFAYCLYGFNDTPELFYKKIMMIDEIVKRVGEYVFLFPQEYEPLNALERHKYVGDGWTSEQLQGLRVLLTSMRGFIPMKCKTVFDWIGRDYGSFLKHIEEIGRGKSPGKVNVN